MVGHQEWIRRGRDDGVFLLVGSIRSGQGGAILATGATPDELRARVAADLFVAHDVVTAEIIEIGAGNRAATATVAVRRGPPLILTRP